MALAAVLAVVAGCGWMGSSPPESEPTAIGSLETGRITVAVLPTVEIAPLMLGIQQGWFADAGLDVKVRTAQNGPATITGIISGEVDIAYSSYVPFIAAQARNVADLRIVTDNSYAAPHTAALVTAPGSGITSVQQLEGKRIAVPGPDTSADLLVKSAMSVNGLDHTTVQWVTLAFPAMPAQLQTGNIDVAMMVEPVITSAEKYIGAYPFLDLSFGPTSELPFTGYGATAEFVREHPNTIAVFQQVMRRAAEASQNRANVERALLETARELGVQIVDEDTAKIVNLPGFRSALDAGQIQRVADLMFNFGVLDKSFDVAPMLVPHPVAVPRTR